jgi:septal ring factor EnvC (AmiA/AmiB activator)
VSEPTREPRVNHQLRELIEGLKRDRAELEQVRAELAVVRGDLECCRRTVAAQRLQIAELEERNRVLERGCEQMGTELA